MPRKKRERKIITIDAETDPFEYGADIQPFCWGIYDGSEYMQFWGEAEEIALDLIDYIYETYDDAIIYAHNGGKFDFFYLLEYFADKIHLINGRIAKAYLKNNEKIEFRDSLLILPVALGAMDKNEVDYMTFKKESREKHKLEILDYLRSDCIFLHKWVFDFVERFGAGLTIAGTALKQVEKTGYPIKHTYKEYDEVFRPFYFGGRVQCFETGAFKYPQTLGHQYKRAQFVDINSAYPDAMQANHPSTDSYATLKRLPKGGVYFARIKAVAKGCLPFRCSETNKLFFPDDDIEREYFATCWEINAGLETNTLEIKSVIISYLFFDTENFKTYIDKYYKEKADAKERGDSTTELFSKFLLNSAYGKFGQNGEEFEEYTIGNDDTDLNEWKPYATTENGIELFSKPNPSDKFYNVATAASITGHVRAKMWRAICQSERPLYCDTDSILCEKFHGTLGKKLGEWDLEAQVTEAYIAQRKMYAVKGIIKGKDKWKTASKGVRLTAQQIKEGVLSGENVEFKRESPSMSLKNGMRYISREVDFKNLENSSVKNPEQHKKKKIKKREKKVVQIKNMF